ncbi:outer membrane protein assembly factor [Lampropedia puyangensis]|uniref:Outer membrane protein assembly factor n=1 Tax=Lampropedia puyangensis TaxID=1330072 RepID=A0A4S8FDB5_9BURK|nr:autotransporter assembly complex family protein [Lampropedia puyangensis]THU04995.1 outer membrane protein assembly factor [Lampropedia puyangensis]
MIETSLFDRYLTRKSLAYRRTGYAALLLLTLGLQGCGVLGGTKTQSEEQDAAQEAGAVAATEGDVAFDVQVHSDDRSIASHLEQHLDVQRYTRFPDLQESEFNRLLIEADANARDLLAALGYFNPELTLTVQNNPEGKGVPRSIVVQVQPGVQTVVQSHQVTFAEPMASNPEAQAQRRRIERRWSLQDGDPFTETDWSAAKSAGLRELQKYRYPTAQIANSQARVDADANKADVSVEYDAGPAYRFGEVKLTGVERYDAQGIRNIARIPTGADYSEEELLDAQQRLAASGYFDSAFLMLDTENSAPDHATVVAQLREAKYQKVVFGVGVSTDAGPRLSIDHTHNKLWPLGWRTVSQLALDSKNQKISSQATAMPNEKGWAWFMGGKLERADVGDVKANSVSLVGGRSKSVGHIDRRYFLQYDISRVMGGSELSGSASSIMANYDWTGRYFDSKSNPSSGYGLGAEVGVGYTLTPQQDPFLRTHLRALQFIPFGARNEVGRRSRLAVRGDLGAVVADSGVKVPASLLFLTGGDTTVRGYGFESIGSRAQGDDLYGGRYMAVGSVEWQRPVTLFGNATDWGHAMFVDAGAVSDETSQMRVYTGVGTGIRWNSPVGPMQADVAYGVQKQQVRVHLRMGFSF